METRKKEPFRAINLTILLHTLLSKLNQNEVCRMVEYVRGSQIDRWHWCKNCTQYPMYIYQKTISKPISDLCIQCKTKEEDRNCKCQETGKGIRNHI